MPGSRVSYHPCRLINDGQIIVLEHYFYRYILRREAGVHRRWNPHRNRLPSGQPVFFGHHPAIDLDQALTNESLQTVPGELHFRMIRQEDIYPDRFYTPEYGDPVHTVFWVSLIADGDEYACECVVDRRSVAQHTNVKRMKISVSARSVDPKSTFA